MFIDICTDSIEFCAYIKKFECWEDNMKIFQNSYFYVHAYNNNTIITYFTIMINHHLFLKCHSAYMQTYVYIYTYILSSNFQLF